MRVKCLAQEHNIIIPGGKRCKETSSPPHPQFCLPLLSLFKIYISRPKAFTPLLRALLKETTVIKALPSFFALYLPSECAYGSVVGEVRLWLSAFLCSIDIAKK